MTKKSAILVVDCIYVFGREFGAENAKNLHRISEMGEIFSPEISLTQNFLGKILDQTFMEKCQKRHREKQNLSANRPFGGGIGGE